MSSLNSKYKGLKMPDYTKNCSVTLMLRISDEKGEDNQTMGTVIFPVSLFAQDVNATAYRDDILKFISSCAPMCVDEILKVADMSYEEQQEAIHGEETKKAVEEVETIRQSAIKPEPTH